MANGATAILSRLERLLPRQLPERSVVYYATYTVVLFVVFLLVTFPHDLVARRVADDLMGDTGWQIRFEDASLVPWLAAYRLDRAELVAVGDAVDPAIGAWLSAKRLTLRPSITGLFGGQATSASFRGESYGGEFSGRYYRTPSPTIDLSWKDFALDRYPRLTMLIEGQWAGRLTGEMHLDLKESIRTAEGRGKLALRDGAITSGKIMGFTVPDLHSTQGEGDFEVKAGRVEIRSLKLTGAEIDADLRGQVYIRLPVGQSAVNGTLNVKPVPGAPGGIEPLLQLLNKNQKPPSGTYTYTLYGTLNRIRAR